MESIEDLSPAQLKRIKQKGFYFNGATHKVEDMDHIKFFIKEFPFYAYIIHKPDSENDSLHLHFLLNIRGTNTIKNIAEILHCDYGDVQICKSHNSYARYMLHLGFDDKTDKYSLSDVVTNDIDRFSSFISEVHYPISTIYADFCNLRSGRITRVDFIEKYKGELSQLNFYQKVRVFKDIDSVSKY